MAHYRIDFGGDEDLERRYAEALQRAMDYTKQVKEGKIVIAEPVAWMVKAPDGEYLVFENTEHPVMADCTYIPLYTHPVKELTDEEWNQVFDFYCETDEGVLRFDYELRDEWKKEQLIRWKKALRNAQEQDGVSLSVINHPIGEPVDENKGLNPDSLETIEIEFPDTPAKTLTDEEIESWITEWAKDLYGTLYVEPTDHQRTMAIKMARAILRKAQEK